MSAADPLPEGTDAIIKGAEGSSDTAKAKPTIEQVESGATASNAGEDFRAMFFDRIGEWKGQAGDSARDYAQAGKDKATSVLDDLVRMVEDAAGEIDDKVGAQYGDYARRAAQGIGGFSQAFKDKDVDTLFADARDLVKKSPAVAIGAAAALGFVVARLVRAGVPETTTSKAPTGAGKDAPTA